MNKAYSVTIKLKPILQQYILHNQNGCVVASRRSFLGKLVHIFLSPVPPGEVPTLGTSPEFITIYLPYMEDLGVEGCLWISPENQVRLENILDAHFREIFLFYVNDKIRYALVTPHGRVVRRARIKDAIIQFCVDYGLSYSEICYESLKKRHYRNRKHFVLDDEYFSILP